MLAINRVVRILTGHQRTGRVAGHAIYKTRPGDDRENPWTGYIVLLDADENQKQRLVFFEEMDVKPIGD